MKFVRVRDVVSFTAFAVIIAFVLGYFASLGLRISPPTHRTNLSMDVPDVNGSLSTRMCCCAECRSAR